MFGYSLVKLSSGHKSKMLGTCVRIKQPKRIKNSREISYEHKFPQITEKDSL